MDWKVSSIERLKMVRSIDLAEDTDLGYLEDEVKRRKVVYLLKEKGKSVGVLIP